MMFWKERYIHAIDRLYLYSSELQQQTCLQYPQCYKWTEYKVSNLNLNLEYINNYNDTSSAWSLWIYKTEYLN